MPNNTPTKTLQILYFASLAEQAGKDTEVLSVNETATLMDIYQIVSDNYQFSLTQNQLAVAINHNIADWQNATHNGDIVAFIPPVAGG